MFANIASFSQAFLKSVLLFAIVLVSGCMSLLSTTEPSDISSESDTPILFDVTKVTYSRQRASSPVRIRVANPKLAYRYQHRNEGSKHVKGVIIENVQFGEAIRLASPLIWGKYLDLRTSSTEDIPTIEMDMRDISGESLTDLSAITEESPDPANARVTYSLGFTLSCRLLGSGGRLVAEFSSTKSASSPSLSTDNQWQTEQTQKLLAEAFNDILLQFFSDERVIAELQETSQPATKVASTKKTIGTTIIVAVFDVFDASKRFEKDILIQLTTYLGASLAQSEKYRVIPRDQLRARLLQEKKGAYKECFDEKCRIELGKAVAAQKTLATQLLRVGSKCAVTASLFDLRSETVEKAAKVKTDCSADALMEAMDKIAEQLSGK